LGTPDLSCREFRAFNPEIVGKFFKNYSAGSAPVPVQVAPYSKGSSYGN
jgi:hypothetical protein